MIAVSERRKRRQAGQEIWEFALVAILFVPLLLGSFVTGMGLIRSIQVTHVARDLTNIYIHGGDFSTYPMQQLAQRLSTGLNLQFPSFSGSDNINTSTTGDAVVRVSQIMWVGGTTSTSCVSVGAANCTNTNSFVFTQRIVFGNSSLGDPNSLGDPTTTGINASGIVIAPITDAGARLPSAAQTAAQTLWQSNTGGRSALVDGQVAYVVEVYASSAAFTLGSFNGGAQYARWFF